MQSLRLAANPEAGFVHSLPLRRPGVLDRDRRHVVTRSISEALEVLGIVLAEVDDGRGGEMYAEQIIHHLGQTLLGQRLVVQQMQHDGVDPLAVLHRRRNTLGKR